MALGVEPLAYRSREPTRLLSTTDGQHIVVVEHTDNLFDRVGEGRLPLKGMK